MKVQITFSITLVCGALLGAEIESTTVGTRKTTHIITLPVLGTDPCALAEGWHIPVNVNGIVDVMELLTCIEQFGCAGDCIADANDDFVVNVFDILELIGNWGPCQ